MRTFNYFNLTTFLTLLASQIATWLTLRYHLEFNIDLLLFGMFLAFPLHFSLQSAFRRRERALEFFSAFKGSLVATRYSLESADELPAEAKSKGLGILRGVAQQLVSQLQNRVPGYQSFQAKLDEFFAFVLQNREQIGGRTVKRIVRYLADTSETSVYLVSNISHRTMAGMRLYMSVFIILFPFIQGPLTLFRLPEELPIWWHYVLMALSAFTLVTLANLQILIEYPFDQKGWDDVKVNEFLLEDSSVLSTNFEASNSKSTPTDTGVLHKT
jgi:hypothetical protein